MSRQPEGKIKDRCRKIAKANGLFFWQIEGKAINGIPDTLAEHVDGLGLVMIEFKTPEGVLSVQQEKRLLEIGMAGQRCGVARSEEDYKRLVGL